MRLTVSHSTTYDFHEAVPYGLQQIRKTPKSTRGQSVLNWTTTIEGGRKEVEFDDFHRNRVELVSFENGTRSITIRSEGEVELEDTQGITGPHQGFAPKWLFLRPTELTEPGAGAKALVAAVAEEDPVARLHSLSNAIRERVTYATGQSEADWTAEDAIKAGTGVCQDHAHVFLTCARLMGAPARYVSGYLMLDDRVDQDAMHAWAEAFVEGVGWIGFDVSNGISPDTRYVRVATGLDYAQAAPVSGTRFGSGAEALTVELRVAQQ